MSEHINIKISGMTCKGCSQGIERKLSRLKFINSIAINWKENTGELDIDDSENKQKAIDSIVQMGYAVEIIN